MSIESQSETFPSNDNFVYLNRISAPQPQEFRRSRECTHGQSLESLASARSAAVPIFRKSLYPLRILLKETAVKFVGRDSPAYADYCAASVLLWVRAASPFWKGLLHEDDPVAAWMERWVVGCRAFGPAQPCVLLWLRGDC